MSQARSGRQDDDLFLALGEEAEAALGAGEVGVWRWKIDGETLAWSRNLEAIHNLPAGSFDGTFQSFARDIHEDDLDAVFAAVQTAVRDGGTYEVRYRNRPLGGAEAIWIEARGGIVRGSDGQRYLTGICQDATDRIEAARQLQRRLAQQQAVSELGSFALAEEDISKILRRAVEVTAETLVVPLAKILEFTPSADALRLVEGIGWADGLVGNGIVGIDQDSQAGYTLLSRDPVIVTDLETETRFSGPPLLRQHCVRSGLSVVIAGDEGRPYGVFGVHTTEVRTFDRADADFLRSVANIVATSVRQARISERRRIVIREMAHRSGNMFQLVQSLFNQTMGTSSNDPAAQSFRARLDSLARTNYLIAQDGWTQTRLRSLADTALAGFRDNIDMKGRDVLLPAALGFDLALVFHELATNSSKYGSLSNSGGRVSLAWRLETAGAATRLLIDWHDDGEGERPAEPAAALGTGFGHRLIRGLVERKWGGEIEQTQDDGFRLRLRVAVPTDIPDPLAE